MSRWVTIPILLFLFLDWVKANSCEESGFTSGLLCSSCDKLADNNLDLLEGSCHACCEKDQVEDAVVKYASALLKVCGWKLGRFPQIKAFVTEEKKEHKYANLVIEYARGASPTLILKDGEGEEVESLSIDKWDTDTIREYLTEHLQA